LIIGTYYYTDQNNQEVVYVDSVKLFSGFNMTKDIKKIEEAKINKQGKELDSLYAIFQVVTDKETPPFKNLQQQIANKSKVFQELQDNYKYTLSNKVWKRLNAYVKEYAQNNSLKIVLGANGYGNVLFGDESLDITDQILEFSNKKYEGDN
jgi:outer membrane protein